MKNMKQWLAGFALALAGKTMPLAVTEQLHGWLVGRTLVWRKKQTLTGNRLGMARLGQIQMGAIPGSDKDGILGVSLLGTMKLGSTPAAALGAAALGNIRLGG